MPGNLGKEKAGRKWKMEKFQRNFYLPVESTFVTQTPCRTGLGPSQSCSAHDLQ
jgi:hypothetical protein